MAKRKKPDNLKTALNSLVGDDGTQSYMSQLRTPQWIFDELTSKKRKWDNDFKAEIRPEFNGACVITCKSCGESSSPTNPSAAVLRHREKCTKKKATRTSPRRSAGSGSAAGEMGDDDDDDFAEDPAGSGSGQPSSRASKQRKISHFVIKGAQMKEFVKYFALFIITSETPFRRVNNYYLRLAMKVVGVQLPDESTFRTALLDQLYAETKAEVDKEILELVQVR